MYRHILIPTDGSELAERGVAQGLALAKFLGAKVSVIFVVEPFEGLVRFSKSGQAAEAIARYAEWRKEQATSVLDRAANAAKEAGVSCETIQVDGTHWSNNAVAAAHPPHWCSGRSAFRQPDSDTHPRR